MLGRHDVTMYLLAAKSLLSFVSKLAVVVHSDGSLTDKDCERVARHIAGVRFVGYQDAERRAQQALGEGSLLAEWRRKDAAYRRLVDVELWRRGEKVIILDSDVLTNREPSEITEWKEHATRPFLLGQSPTSGKTELPSDGAHVQMLFLHKIPEISRLTGYPAHFLQGTTAGCCGYTHEISLPTIESALRASLEVGLPMQQWGGDQCLIIYLLSAGGAERLPEDSYLNFEPRLKDAATRAKIVHFYGTHRFHGLVYPRLAAETVRRLRRDAGGPPPAATRE